MRIGIIGSGIVAQTLGRALADQGHETMLGTRDPSKLKSWQSAVRGPAQVGAPTEAARHGDVILNATSGLASVAALEAAGAANLAGKILIDVANPLDFSQGFPPTLAPVNTDSLGEQIQRAFPTT